MNSDTVENLFLFSSYVLCIFECCRSGWASYRPYICGHLFGCISCPAISSRGSSVPAVLLLSSSHRRSPLLSQSPKVKLNHTEQKQSKGKKKNNPEIRKRFDVPTVLRSTGHSFCLLCYFSPSKEQFLGKKDIARELPISSASLLGFHFREGRNLKWS